MQPGDRLGPYEITGELGAGGMGVVYRARDERLGREVAVKVLPETFAASADRVRRFEQEARAAAALNHPNILAIHDVGTWERSPFIVTELLEGETLRRRLRHGPLPGRKAVAYAAQIAGGLTVAHAKGIIHRDLKPDNLFVTREGLVKILDFGLAKLTQREVEAPAGHPSSATTDTAGMVGTVGYMSPEQLRAQEVTAATDIFALGCVLYEMLAGRRAFAGETAADTISAVLHEDPPPLSGPGRERVVPPPLEKIVLRCLEKRPEDRFASARDLSFALEAAAEAVPRDVSAQPVEEPQPYPGLAAFTAADAENFFGREAEVAQMWERIPGRTMLALIGPSGAGKSSFLRAGLVPHAPSGWRCVVATPGQSPCKGLARALANELRGDATAFSRLLDFDDPDAAVEVVARWRQGHGQALVIVDQLEELFTLNPPEVQTAFAALLGRLVDEAGVHLLLSLRDDFFFQCHGHDALQGVFREVTPLGPPVGEALRRAVVKPAEQLGFGFDDGLTDEMIAEVAAEKGALPLLAFTVARLWELRDRDARKLTREAYQRIGGVGGALARHAETVLERIGDDRQPIIRELFRNLVTSHGTRAVRDADELLSVFPERQRAEARDVLSRLVDARLLTSFEEDGGEGEAPSRHRIEIVHESLLSAWPRLVRWQTQDADGARLRDEVRQAARLWAEHGRSDDYLWSGKAYREFAVWRDAYPGGLSGTEEAFARAMTVKAERFRRRRRNVVVGVLAAVVVVAAALGVLLWKSLAETAKREAGQLLALGRLKAATAPSAGLAFAVASLERADNVPARRFAVEALWKGPPMLVLRDPAGHYRFQWSPDGRWLALSAWTGVALWERDTNTRRLLRPARDELVGFTVDGTRLVTQTGNPPKDRKLDFWALPEGRLERTLEIEREWAHALFRDFLVTRRPLGDGPDASREFHRVSLDGATRQRLPGWERLRGFAFDPTGAWLLVNDNGHLTVKSADAVSAAGRDIGMHEASVRWGPWTDRAVTGDESGELRIWDLTAGRLERTLKGPCNARLLAGDPSRRYVAAGLSTSSASRALCLFDLAAPNSAEPVSLLGVEEVAAYQLRFSPDGGWIATSHDPGMTLWATAGARSLVVGRHEAPNVAVTFADDGHLLSTSDNSAGVVKRWPLDPADQAGLRELLRRPGSQMGSTLELDPAGHFALVEVNIGATPIVIPFDGSPARVHQLTRPESAWMNSRGARLDPQGRRLATFVFTPPGTFQRIRILDLETGAESTLDTSPAPGERCEDAGWKRLGTALPVWLPDGRLLSDGDAGIKVWDLAAGTSTLLRPCRGLAAADVVLPTPDSRSLVRLTAASATRGLSKLVVVDLVSGAEREIASHGARVTSVALDRSGRVLLTGDADGVVRVGPLSGEEPHLLYGHTGPVTGVAVSPDGRRIASGSDDGTIRLWDMPDLATPPLHTLARGELLAKLRSYTNLRAVRDPSADTGWKIEIGPFPGWAVVPAWAP